MLFANISISSYQTQPWIVRDKKTQAGSGFSAVSRCPVASEVRARNDVASDNIQVGKATWTPPLLLLLALLADTRRCRHSISI